MAISTLTEWSETPSESTNMLFITKAIDFGDPFIEKMISNISFTHSSNVTMHVLLSVFYRTSVNDSFTYVGGTALSGYNEESKEINNFDPFKCKILQLKFIPFITVNTGEYSLSDITIQYRPLRKYSSTGSDA